MMSGPAPTHPTFPQLSIEPTKILNPENFQDPALYGHAAVSEHVAIGLASVVTNQFKSHNWANNEDAAAIYKDEDVTLLMVADAHNGYVAARESVRQFPEVFLRRLRNSSGEDIRQVYVDAVLILCDRIEGCGKKSGVQYPGGIFGKRIDSSQGQFCSVLAYKGKYYSVSLGDVSRSKISSEGITPIPGRNTHVGCVGGFASPRRIVNTKENT